jgi:hypothetical protein
MALLPAVQNKYPGTDSPGQPHHNHLFLADLMMKKMLITGILIISAISGAVTAYASEGTFTVYPSHTHNGNRSWIIRQAAPGAEIQESLTLENLSDESQQISIQINEARTENDKFIPVTGQPYENIGNWIRLPQASYALAPREKMVIPFTISVPGTSDRQRYNAAIFAVKTEKNAGGVNIVTQIGVRIYLDVTPGNIGFSDVFNTYGFKNSFFFLLSMAGVFASVLYYLINHFETRKHARQQA